MNGDPRKIVPSRNDPKILYALFSRSINILTEDEVTKEVELKFEGRALEVNESANEVYVGDTVIYYSF